MLQQFLAALEQNIWLTAATVFLATLGVLWLRAWITYKPPEPLKYMPRQVGDTTLQTLQKYDGRDFSLPLLLAVRGKVYDVTEGRDFYGPGAGYHVFAGKECSRALATMQISAADCNNELASCSIAQIDTLKDWERRFSEKYTIVGQVVPLRPFTLQQLAEHDGSDPGKPILLAIRAVVFDVTTGKDFYGPDGMYPFAGKECSYAFAKLSTELEDCHNRLDDLSKAEQETLHEWEEKFMHKYPVVGEVQDDVQDGEQAQ